MNNWFQSRKRIIFTTIRCCLWMRWHFFLYYQQQRRIYLRFQIPLCASASVWSWSWSMRKIHKLFGSVAIRSIDIRFASRNTVFGWALVWLQISRALWLIDLTASDLLRPSEIWRLEETACACMFALFRFLRCACGGQVLSVWSIVLMWIRRLVCYECGR